jgi:hypothetical protein
VRTSPGFRFIGVGAALLVLTLVAGAAGLVVFVSSASGAQDFAPISTFNGVACASASQCIAVGTAVSSVDSGATASLDPGSGELSAGSSVQLIGSSGLLNGVSCASSSVCLAVGEDPQEAAGVAVPLDPSTGTVLSGEQLRTIPGIFIAGVACASATQCLAVGHDPSGVGVAVALDPSTGTILEGQGLQAIPGTGGVGLEAVACPSASLCVAVGENSGESAGIAVPLAPATGAIVSGQSVQSVTRKGVLVGLSCASSSLCLAVGWGASEPSLAVPINPATGALASGQSDQSISTRAEMLSAVSCPSSLLCLAVGNDTGDPPTGQAVPIDATTGTIVGGQAVQTLAGTGSLNAVVCPSSAECLAVGSSFESIGAMTEELDPATGTAAGRPPATTTPSVPSAPSTPGATQSGQVLASTGTEVALSLAVGVGLVLGGASLWAASGLHRRRPRHRSSTTR